MASRELALLLLLSISLSHSVLNAQWAGCSLEAINLDPCLNQGTISTDSCCFAIDQVVKTGYYCLCSLLDNTNPLFTGSFTFAVATCYLSSPPLTQCPGIMPPTLDQKPLPPHPPAVMLPPTATVPSPPTTVPFPVSSTPPLVVFPPSPLHEVHQPKDSSNITQVNSTHVRLDPHPDNETISNPSSFNSANNANERSYYGQDSKNLVYKRVLWILVLHAYLL